MPQLIFKNIEKNIVEEKSEMLINRLAKEVNIVKEYISIEVPSTDYIIKPNFSICEVVMFDREDEVKENIAKVIYETLEVLNLDVYFMIISNENYFENGKRF